MSSGIWPPVVAGRPTEPDPGSGYTGSARSAGGRGQGDLGHLDDLGDVEPVAGVLAVWGLVVVGCQQHFEPDRLDIAARARRGLNGWPTTLDGRTGRVFAVVGQGFGVAARRPQLQLGDD